MAITVDDGDAIQDTAARSGLLTGSAPDTFLGGSHQTCRRLVDDGAMPVDLHDEGQVSDRRYCSEDSMSQPYPQRDSLATAELTTGN